MLESALSVARSLIFVILATFGVNLGTEQPPYSVIARIRNDIEIRAYEKRIVPETTVAASARRSAFQIVAGYIFGANRGRKQIAMTSPVEISSPGVKIAMTSPVEIKKSESALVMRFFMPSGYSLKDLPEPLDAQVKLVELESTTVAVLRFSGSGSDATVSRHTEELLNALKATQFRVTGAATAFFYNPPWTIPFMRRNEIAVPVSVT